MQSLTTLQEEVAELEAGAVTTVATSSVLLRFGSRMNRVFS